MKTTLITMGTVGAYLMLYCTMVGLIVHWTPKLTPQEEAIAKKSEQQLAKHHERTK